MRQQAQRQTGRVDQRILFGLPAVGGQRLPEVSRPVVQPHRDERQAQIGGGLEVIAGQDAQTAGVVRQHLRDAELHREVRDRGGQTAALGALFTVPLQLTLVPHGAIQIVMKITRQGSHPVDETIVGSQLIEPLRRDRPHDRNRIVVGLLPQLLIDIGEEIPGGLMPRPAQVVG